MDSNMVRRVSFAVVAIPLLVGIVWFGEWPLAVLLMLASVLGARELFDLAERHAVVPLRYLGLALSAAVPGFMMLLLEQAPARILFTDQWGYLILLAVLLVVGAAVFTRTVEQRPLASVAVTLLAPLYAAMLPSVAMLIRHAQWGSRSWAGTALVLFPLVITWVCDSAAMFAGRRIGGAKMAPTISPGKTWAGGIAGVVGGTLVGALFALFVLPRVGIELNVSATIALAIAISVLGQVGDLAESLFKREAGVKDSSALIPGHGGVLDRLDSLYFAIPVAAAGFHLMGIM